MLTIKKPKQVNQDQRGKVYEWCRGQPGYEIIAQWLKKGEISYPTPILEDKRYFLVAGKTALSTEKEVYNLENETEINLDKTTPHSFRAYEDSILLEYRHSPVIPEKKYQISEHAIIRELEYVCKCPEVRSWCSNLQGMQITLYYRKKGEPSGYHFHKGEDLSKNPERFLPLAGRMHLQEYDGTHIKLMPVQIGQEIIIPKNIFHSVNIDEDAIFAEYRQTQFNRSYPDTYPIGMYEEHLISQNIPYNKELLRYVKDTISI